MLHINYTRHAPAFSDFEIEDILINSYNITKENNREIFINHSTENVQFAVRALVTRNLICPTKIKFYLDNIEIGYDVEKNEFLNWPDKYCTAQCDWQNEIFETKTY